MLFLLLSCLILIFFMVTAYDLVFWNNALWAIPFVVILIGISALSWEHPYPFLHTTTRTVYTRSMDVPRSHVYVLKHHRLSQIHHHKLHGQPNNLIVARMDRFYMIGDDKFVQAMMWPLKPGSNYHDDFYVPKSVRVLIL